MFPSGATIIASGGVVPRQAKRVGCVQSQQNFTHPNRRGINAIDISCNSFKVDPNTFWDNDDVDEGAGGGGGLDDNMWRYTADGDGNRGDGGRWPFLLLLTFSSGIGGYLIKKSGWIPWGDRSSTYDRDPIRVLKRLVAELFERDVDIQSRLATIEQSLGISIDDAPANASKVADEVSSSSRKHVDAPLRSLGGRLAVGGGFLNSQDDDVDAMLGTGVKLGTTLTLQARGKFREGRDFLIADIAVDKDDMRQFALEKVLYSCELSSSTRALLAPFGARGNDVTYTLNPFAGRGLTSATCDGNPLLHNRGTGSVVAGSLSLPRFWVSGAYFGSETEDGQDIALLQMLAAPLTSLSIGCTLLERQGPDALFKQYGESMFGSLFSGGVSSVISSASSSSGLNPQQEPTLESAGSFALSLGKYALHGWAVSPLEFGSSLGLSSWGISLGDKLPSGPWNSRWVASISKHSASTSGVSLPSTPQSATQRSQLLASETSSLKPDAFEVSTEFDFGGGLRCQPGIVGVRQGSKWTLLAGAKTVWDF